LWTVQNRQFPVAETMSFTSPLSSVRKSACTSTKDAGIDLLVTDPRNSKGISLQVKFSKDFLGSLGNSLSEAVATTVKSGGWWTFKPDKIKHSKAGLCVLVLYRFTRRDYDFVVIERARSLRTTNRA
jgi:hypothetical protein